MVDIQFTARNTKLNESSKDYIRGKIAKHRKLLEKAIGIKVLLDKTASHRGVSHDLKLELSVKMPHAFIKVEEKGEKLKDMIDKLEATLRRRLRRYYDQFKRWEKSKPWKAAELNSRLTNAPEPLEEIDSYADYIPSIRGKQYADEKPLHPAEAIEQMELLGHRCFLFKNLQTNKYSMIYKDHDEEYRLVEPKKGG